MNLSNEQLAIVTADDANIVISAGAGSGKTRVLTERIRHLIVNKKVKPSSIVGITFTNLAAQELQDRLANIPGIGDAFIGTIHSFGNTIFKTSGSSYAFYTGNEQVAIMCELINRYAESLSEKEYLAYIDACQEVADGLLNKNDPRAQLKPSSTYELKVLSGDPVTAKDKAHANPSFLKKAIVTSEELRKQRNLITFSELLEKSKAYFNEIGASVEYVLVDEFQDVSRDEYQFIMGLNAENYFIVGDDWQAIYGFKGANVSLFKSLINRKDWSHYKLVDNYRNAHSVTQTALTVISQVPERIKKSVNLKRTEQGSVTIDSRLNLDPYLTKIKNQGNFGDFAILTRSNYDLVKIATQLRQLGIPMVSFKASQMSADSMKSAMASNAVKVLTVHSSKGLEFPNVLLYGNFPLDVPSYRVNKEERRVMYVGITRAEDHLTILN